MPGMDRDVVLEALSALTGATVKPHTWCKALASTELLTVESFLPTVLVLGGGGGGGGGVSALASLLNNLALGIRQNNNFCNKLFVDIEEFLDPRYDYDFRDLEDTSECSRGGESYQRPVGWYRFTLKVKDKYPGGNAWLGSIGWRSYSEAGEWPVSFHGTGIEGAEGITHSHYRAGDRQAYGRGIYSTPDIGVAKDYAMSKTFTSKKTGNTYEVIMQNRINPQKRMTVKPDFWLIPVPEGSTAEQEQEIVESSIRPYGILIKEVTQ